MQTFQTIKKQDANKELHALLHIIFQPMSSPVQRFIINVIQHAEDEQMKAHRS